MTAWTSIMGFGAREAGGSVRVEHLFEAGMAPQSLLQTYGWNCDS